MKFGFIDESGDTTFFSKRGKFLVGSPGCSAYLQICIVITDNAKALRKGIRAAQKKALTHLYLKGIPSLEKRRSNFIFHASEDAPEVRQIFYEAIKELDFEAHTIIVHKKEALFKSKYNEKPNVFYNTTVKELFERCHHCLDDKENHIAFEKRLRKSKETALTNSIAAALDQSKKEGSYNVYVQHPDVEPCLQISDYINRAIQRAHTK